LSIMEMVETLTNIKKLVLSTVACTIETKHMKIMFVVIISI